MEERMLKGIWAPLTTPFNDQDEIDFDALVHNILRYEKSRLEGYLLLGSNGEPRSMLESERRKLLEFYASQPIEKNVMVGISVESMKQAKYAIHQVTDLGFNTCLVSPPSYFSKMADGEVIVDFYLQLAASSSIKIILYNCPGFLNNVAISPKLLHRFFGNPNIIGIKDSGSSGPFAFLSRANLDNPDFSILSGTANFLYPALHCGATGGVVSLANAIPDTCVELYDLFLKEEYSQARELHNRLQRINQEVSGIYGVAGVKAAMDICGYNGLNPRSPYRKLDENQRAKIRQILEKERMI
ncbi:dihydrodipicolinate synthase family protein [Pleomorphochaeta sp. DL1XJH-081]|uniref:dihydrodipicolinate synthase family protein n=1 Tax=Pleomorphochaeta sp. DL1XJH-081 TaxID=3409690 RepID=UPI003BB6B3B4